jgi:transposase
VYGSERHVLLRHYLEAGLSKTAIAGRLGLDRSTIHRWLRAGDLDRDLDAEAVPYRPRPPRPSKLDPYRPLLEERLADYPDLTAVRLFAEIRAAGYRGGLSQLKVLVHRLRPPPPVEEVVRFETPPGQQAQVDFARFVLPWGVRYALLVVLSYSRLLWLRFGLRQDLRTLLTGLEAAFASFGGVPRELLFDQMRAVITRDGRLEGGRLVTNAEFLRFAHHWSFRPRACRPYRAQTKGKVERPIRYLRQSFLYGRSFAGDADLQAQAEHWLATVANVRRHATTLERPVERFERDERATLQPLATRPYCSLVLLPPVAPRRPAPLAVPAVAVEHRPLRVYAQLTGGAP